MVDDKELREMQDALARIKRQREKWREYYTQNKQHLKECKREYYAQNKEELLLKSKIYYYTHRDEILKKRKQKRLQRESDV